MLNSLFSLKFLPAAGLFPIQLVMYTLAYLLSFPSGPQQHNHEGAREETIYLKVI